MTTRWKTFFVRAAALALLVAAPSVLSAGAAAAADDSSWAVRTGSNSFGSDRTSFTYALSPGGTADDTLVVLNRGATPLRLSVYTADGYTTTAGQFDLLAQDGPSVGVGAWIAPEQGTVTVPAGGEVDVPFAVAIPANATPGDYAGGIVTSLVRADATQGINVDQRLGIRINLRVGGTLTPTMTVEDAHVSYHGTSNPFGTGDATVSYTIHNTGNAILSARQTASAAGPFGWLPADAGSIDAPPQLLPGESWVMTVPVHGVHPAFLLSATVTVTPQLTDASGSTTPLDAITVTARGWAVPWTLAVVVVVLLLAVVAVVLVARRRRKRRAADADARVREAVEEALRQRDEPAAAER